MSRLLSTEEWRPRGIEGLEPSAELVVRSGRAACVIAGPGAGKTELLAQRASFLLETGGCPYPRRILAISFKRDAAKNLRERVLKRSGQDLGRRFDSFTFDAFAKGVLDQFMGVLPAELRPTAEHDVLAKDLDQQEIEEILLKMSPPASLGSTSDLRQFASKKFFTDDVPTAPLLREPKNLHQWAAREFWYLLLQGSPRSKLSFRMITRLAGELLGMDARLLRAYRVTYSHVFLDEFQDTTSLQYWLMCVLFEGTQAVSTAVGDPQQRIMVWAGALKGVFDRYRKDFGADVYSLQRNYRASATIAPIVRFIASRLIGDGNAGRSATELAAELPGTGPPENACAAYVFPDDDAEARWIAGEVNALIAGGTSPRNVAVLVRMRSDQYGAAIIGALRESGIRARIEDRIQDLLTEPIVAACILGLRALACNRVPGAWASFRDAVADLRGLDYEDVDRRARLDGDLTTVRRALQNRYPTPIADGSAVRGIVREYLEDFVGPLRGKHAQYRRGDFLEKCVAQLCDDIASAEGLTWEAVLDDVEGSQSVPILTIHKSKGLEYDAVFFVGLEDGAFWNFENNRDEESNIFFVAVSRARSRVAFTFSKVRGHGPRKRNQFRAGIADLYGIMKSAGVKMLEVND